MLDHYEIPYHYEHPTAVVDRGQVRLWYPDFSLRGSGILIEYYGRVQDPEYAAGMARKQAVYRENGIEVLMVTPEELQGPRPKRILDRIERTLCQYLLVFQHLRKRDHF